MKKVGALMIFILLLSGFTSPKPRVLIIGDSISIGYFPYVKECLENEAIVIHNKGNAQNTGTGLEKLQGWLGDEKWDVIQFNWGLWDMVYAQPGNYSKGFKDRVNGKASYPPDEYARNLDSLVQILKKTGAKLIFVTTSYVPENEPRRFAEDAQRYNKIAKKIMKANGVLINDIYSKSRRIHKKAGKSAADVHYTAEGYKMLGVPVCNVLKRAL